MFTFVNHKILANLAELPNITFEASNGDIRDSPHYFVGEYCNIDITIDENGNVTVRYPRKNWQMPGWHDHRLDGWKLREDVLNVLKQMPLPKEAFIETIT